MKISVAIPLVVLGAVLAQAVPLQWAQSVPDASTPPDARKDAGFAYDEAGRRLFVFGGRGAAGTLSDTWMYTFADRKWKQFSPATSPPPRHSMLAGYHSTVGFVISTGQDAGFFNDVWAFDPTADTGNGAWTELSSGVAGGPEPRYGSAGGLFTGSNFMYVSHGFSSVRYSNTFRFDVIAKTWEETFEGTNPYNPNKPHARCLMGSEMTGSDKFVFFGGCLSGGKSGGPCPSPDSWQYDLGHWNQMTDCPVPRLYTGMAAYGTDKVIMYGGQEKTKQITSISKTPSDEVSLLDPSSKKWSQLKITGTTPVLRFSHGMAAGNNAIVPGTAAVVFGGESTDDGTLLNDVWVLSGNLDETETTNGCRTWGSTVIFHAVFMFIGWGVLLQAGGFIARYCRHIENAFWFKAHRSLQSAGLIFAVIGLIFGFVSVQSGHFSFAHGGLGLFIMIVGLLQPLNAFFRPHKHDGKDPTTARIVWEYLHKNAGRLALLLALINITLGLFLIVAPVAVWGVWLFLFAAFVVAYIVMEARLQAKSGSLEA